MADTLKRKDVTEDLLPLLARKRATAVPIGRDLNQKIYRLSGDWENAVLEADINVTKVMSTAELEAAIQDPEIVTIMVPAGAAVTEELLFRVVERNALSKTIFLEA